jgi:hypothetical protein
MCNGTPKSINRRAKNSRAVLIGRPAPAVALRSRRSDHMSLQSAISTPDYAYDEFSVYRSFDRHSPSSAIHVINEPDGQWAEFPEMGLSVWGRPIVVHEHAYRPSVHLSVVHIPKPKPGT